MSRAYKWKILSASIVSYFDLLFIIKLLQNSNAN